MTSLVKTLSNTLGTSEASVRLLLSLFLPYGFAFLYRKFLKNQSSANKNLYFLSCGLFLSVYNYGSNAFHSVVAVIFSFLVLQIVPPSSTNVIINFVFHMGYLLVGYWINANDRYDFTWTMPHCVLTLRLIGLSFDLWDGSQDPDKLSNSFKKTALKRQPTFLEIASFVFFPSAYLIGPQFPMIKYIDYIEGKYDNAYDSDDSKAVKQAFRRCFYGILYMTMFQIGSKFVNEWVFLTDEYINGNIWKKHLALGLLCKIFITKYVSCWLITEGACILFGLAYNGKDENGEVLWDGCRNVKLAVLENIMKFNHYIEAFNINTNAWVAQNIYKRMKFLNNPNISRLGTLLFLAAWHGVYSGYYIAFAMQFFIIVMEKDLEVILAKYFSSFVSFTEKPYVYPFRFVFLKLYSTVFLGYCVIPFALLRFEKWWTVHKSLYFSGYLIFMPYMILYRPILLFICKKYFSPKKELKEKEK